MVVVVPRGAEQEQRLLIVWADSAWDYQGIGSIETCKKGVGVLRHDEDNHQIIAIASEP